MTRPGIQYATGFLVALVFAVTTTVTAQDFSPQVIRASVMGSNNFSLSSLADAARNGRFSEAGKEAKTLADNAKALANLWPQGSGEPDTSALPAIWQNLDGFMAKLANFRKAAESAVAAAAAQDIGKLRTAADGVRRACDSCHRTYRSS